MQYKCKYVHLSSAGAMHNGGRVSLIFKGEGKHSATQKQRNKLFIDVIFRVLSADESELRAYNCSFGN